MHNSDVRHIRTDNSTEEAQKAAAIVTSHDHAKASERDQTLEVLHEGEIDPVAFEAAVASCSLPPLPANPPAINSRDFAIYMGGIIFSKEQVARWCIDARGMSEAFVEYAGPLTAAQQHFSTFFDIDCPSFHAIHFYDNYTNLPRHGYFFICRVAFVEQGYMQPRLVNDEKTRAFIDYWFPPHIRSSPAFATIEGSTYKYDGLPWMCTLAYLVGAFLF